MVISYLGAEAFKIQYGDIVIAYNPVSKDSKLKSSNFGADIAISSNNHQDMNGVENASRGDKMPFIINGPGEYETKGVFIHGFQAKTNYGGEERVSTVYTMNLENMNLCFLGPIGTKDLSDDVLEEIEEVDILFVPIGGGDVLGPAEAYKMAVSFEPKLIVPMHFSQIGSANSLETFIKEGGDDVEKLDKLTIKKKDLDGKNGNIVVINPSA